MPTSPPSPDLVGSQFEVDVGAVAHGGHCVARIGDVAGGRVVFVRHALPGERVLVRVTEDRGGSFVRADAIAVVRPSDGRVEPSCAYAGPGRCGGCDWQHVRPDVQRALKGDVVREQFARLAGLEVDVVVAELAGGPLHWRTRISYAIDADGRAGLLRHRSHEIELIESCPLGVTGVGDGAVFERTWVGSARIEAVRGGDERTTLLAQPIASRPKRGPVSRRRQRPVSMPFRVVEGPARLEHTVVGLDGELMSFDTTASDFWQVHPAAAQVLSDVVVAALAPRAGDRVLDLYCGAGLFAARFAAIVGPNGLVVGVESDAESVADAAANLARWPWAQARPARVSVALLQGLDLRPDLIVLDPPRSGVGLALMSAVLEVSARAVAYVSCDPASLARDVRVALERGWLLQELSAYDAFPMTHHIECIAILTPN